MCKKNLFLITALCIFSFICYLPAADAKSPKGAKAIFDSGEGPSIGMSVNRAPKPASDQPVKKEKYTGISYQMVLILDDGQFKPVSKARAFKSGEKMKMIVRTNRSGYLTIFNIGSSGKTNLLFNEYVDAFTMQEVPRNTNFMFVGAPGTETVLLMLSDMPNPIATQTTTTASAPSPGDYPDSTPLPPPAAAELPDDAAPPPADAAALPPPPATIVADINGSKNIRGAKDIVVEDSMQNSYAVVSPKNGWKPVRGGMKDIVLESSSGSNYGVVPAAAIADGGILTLEIKLKHR